MSERRHVALEGLEYASISDIGLRRTNNQDSYAAVPANNLELWRDRGHLFIVADGMGAHAAGELASKMAVDAIPLVYDKHRELPPPDALRFAVEEANAGIHNRGEANAEFHGMGTTATSLVLLPQGALVAHVGDSRVYRLRGNQLEQLSYDHSLAWEMATSAKVSADEVPGFVPRNVITRSLGPHADVDVDLEGPFPIEPGDTFFLCSDGLSGQVSDEEIGAVMSCLAPEEAAQALVDLANLRGGPDNVTVIVVRITDQTIATRSADRSWTAVTPSKRSTPKPQPAVFLVVLLLFAALVMVLLSAGQYILAAAAGVAFVATAAFIVARRFAAAAPTRVAETRLLGKAPYRTANATPSEAITSGLAHLVQQLGEAATDEGWVVDWQRFGALRDDAAQAARSEDFRAAVRAYCRAASFMMREVRHQKSRHPADGGAASSGA